jgi:rhamnogalacturonyl hydrolase YesR
MEPYFDESLAVSERSGGSISAVLELIAGRYIGANPRLDYTGRPFTAKGVKRNAGYRYEADFSKWFPDAPDGSYVYVWGKYRASEEGYLKFSLIPAGPVKIWMNGEPVYATDVFAERYADVSVPVNLPLKKGWNHLVLRFTRTKAGFGGEFGTWLGKADYYFFRGNTPEGTPEIEGFDYTAPMPRPLAEINQETLSGLCLPLPEWTDEERAAGCFGRIFGTKNTGGRAVARTLIFSAVQGEQELTGTYKGKCTLYVGNTLVFSGNGKGGFTAECVLEEGLNRITVISECPAADALWDFTLSGIDRRNPFFPEKTAWPWIYAGPFSETPDAELLAFDRELLVGGAHEKTWWRLDMSGGWVRLYNENPLYGHWHYPLGVTLYGLIETARYFEKAGAAIGPAIGAYVQAHVAKSVRTLDYALFDKGHFGGATSVHHLLSSIDSLDDCGAFGALMLEAAKDRDIGAYQEAADYVGNHILHKQDRLPEGAFYRKKLMHHFHNGTMWADDLYMSVPFLCRYAQLKKETAVLDDAALQFEGFKKYLFMEDRQLMAHVYDFKRNMNTGIPWGRGNGWTIFSLTELLMVLPKDHPKRNFLLDFFQSLAAGCLGCQDKNGMWYQVLNMPSSYPETSCTAMFICAFSRGIRYNWFRDDETPYRIAAERAWSALEHHSIDKDGNIYGVCRGSEFAFNPRYYAEHLLPRFNDTHGIGIVLLAGVELLKLRSNQEGGR